ncbi:TauD/TfdA dioxygenase family protein [Streptomyces anulatus]
MLVLPDQHLNHANLLAAAALFGTVDTATDRRYTVPGFPGLTVVSNIHQDGTPIGIYDGDQEEEWHADNSFKPQLTAATLLYSVITPAEGGETRFADATRAYADLPACLQARVEDLSAVHSVQHLAEQQADAAGGLSSTQTGTLTQLPVVTHPLVPVHPVTGARALLLGSMVISRIEGLPEADGWALLADLLARTPRPAARPDDVGGQSGAPGALIDPHPPRNHPRNGAIDDDAIVAVIVRPEVRPVQQPLPPASQRHTPAADVRPGSRPTAPAEVSALRRMLIRSRSR